jgi:hypothetical protein
MKKTILLSSLIIFLLLQFFPQMQSSIHVMNGQTMAHDMNADQHSDPCQKATGCIDLKITQDHNLNIVKADELPEMPAAKAILLVICLLAALTVNLSAFKRTFRKLKIPHLRTVATTVFIE